MRGDHTDIHLPLERSENPALGKPQSHVVRFWLVTLIVQNELATVGRSHVLFFSQIVDWEARGWNFGKWSELVTLLC